MAKSAPPPPRSGQLPDLDREAVDRALATVIPDARDRAFVLRCILEEGPRHHRIASWALLRALAGLLESRPPAAPLEAEAIPTEPLRMRLPPSVAQASEDAAFPIGIPKRLLARSLEDDEDAAIALEALADGPPHHALANAVMLWLMEALAGR